MARRAGTALNVLIAPPAGIEPAQPASEAGTLSTELREQIATISSYRFMNIKIKEKMIESIRQSVSGK